MARLTKEKWLEEGLKILSEFAQHKLRILYLCERLGVTRGSFYHHFNSIEGYIRALVEFWKEQNTVTFIEATQSAEGAEEKMKVLNEQILKTDQAVEAAIRSWSYYQPIVKENLAEVDQMRLRFLQEVFMSLGTEAERAYQLAQLDYAMLVGIQQLFPQASESEMRELFKVYTEVYTLNR